MKNVLLLALIALAFCAPAFSESTSAVEVTTANEDPPAALEEMFAETKDRLDLSDEQVKKIEPILQSSYESQQAVLQKYGIDIESGEPPAHKLGFRKARAMGQELQTVRASTAEALEDILTKEQMREYETMQDERRNKMRERIRAGR